MGLTLEEAQAIRKAVYRHVTTTPISDGFMPVLNNAIAHAIQWGTRTFELRRDAWIVVNPRDVDTMDYLKLW